ncbi:MAG: TonB-dependent receptor plug domain-containing protein [Gammaproteobacteria bacterium]
MSTTHCISGLAGRPAKACLISAIAVSVVAAGVMLVPATGYAQIAEIVVTTRKKEENLQEVPLAVTAITAEQIERQGISSLDDVTNQDPSVQIDTSNGPADTRETVRGLSNTRGRSNVAFLVDGIDVTTENLNAGGSGLLANRRLLSDVERIEVIKGPQSALYGRAAFAGAISYVTKNPGDEFEGKVNVDFGDYGKREVGLSLSGPLIDGVLGMRASSIWYTSDGYYTNSLSGENLADVDGRAFALTTVYTPTDQLRFKLRGEYSKEDSGPLPNVRFGGGRQGYNLRLYEYPQVALDAGLGQNGQYIPAAINGGVPGWDTTSGSTSTALINFGQYCPPELQDPSRGPGFCVPTHYGSGKGKVVTQSENPLTGQDFSGTSTETRRIALETTLDVGVGLFSAYTGYTDFDGRDAYDQDWQATGRPDTLLGEQTAGSSVNTQQFSNEIRFASQLDGPLQFTLGALYWTETRKFDDTSVIIFCTLTRRSGSGPTETDLVDTSSTSYCDGQNGTLDNWQDYYKQLQPQTAGPWRADTDSWSFYGVLEWQMTDDWTLTFEDRFVSESFDFSKPNQSSCTQFFGPNPGGVKMEKEVIGPDGVTPINDQVCSAQYLLDPRFNYAPLPISLQGTQGYRINRGSTTSHFNTPKLTLQWQASDSAQYYFSWANAQKPGGIAATPGGGAPVTMNDDRFDPEKMTAWELGAKTDWDVAGQLRLNVAGFYQDYADKQVGTQVLQDGVLQPRVVNASSAEVWGAEVDAQWAPDFFTGLTLRLAYTYLDPTYSDFFDDTTSVLRAANSAGSCSVVYKGGQGVDPTDLSDPANGGPYCRLDLSGNQLERTPKHAVVTGFNVTRPFLDTAFEWTWDFNAQWQSKRYTEADNAIYFDSYWLADTSIGLIGDKMDFLIYVDNLFDDDTIKTGGSGPDFGAQVVELGFTAGLGVTQYFGTLPNPRQFGIRASYKF